MQLNQQIKKVRNSLLKKNQIEYSLLITIVISLLFFLIIQLESIFYFSPNIKTTFYFYFSISVIFFLIFWFFYFFEAKRNNVDKYKIETLADLLGKSISQEKKDVVINALQLESNSRRSESTALANSYVQLIGKKLESMNLGKIINSNIILKFKFCLLFTWIGIAILFFFKYDSSADAFFRLINPKQNFPAPKPFSLVSMSGNIQIIGGEKPEIFVQAHPLFPDTLHLRLTPLQTSTKKRDSLILDFYSVPIEDGVFNFKLPEIYQDYSYQAMVNSKHFWEAWKIVTTNTDTIFVTDRPKFEKFRLSINPPVYSKLDKVIQKGNIAMVESLKGSVIEVDLTANRILKNAYIKLNGEKYEMSSSYKKAVGSFVLMEEGQFTVNISDERGITNKDPIPYKLNIIPDNDPLITVIKPLPVTELGNNQTIPIHLEINDDFGFTDLQLAYEIQRPAYLQTDTYVAMFNLDELSPDSISQTIKMFWDLTDMALMPEDEVRFHFELTDNDNISGPKKTVSNTLIARVPSLADLYDNLENNEKDVLDNIFTELDELSEMRKQLETTELKLLKNDNLNWEEQQSLKSTLEKSVEKIESMEKLAKAMESITDQAEKHKLFSPELIEKFKELSELVNAIIPEEMKTNISDMESALENMDVKSMQDALNDLSDNMEKIEQDLDRYLEIFKRFQAEQKLDEIQNRMKNLFNQQTALDNQLKKTKENSNDGMRLAQEEQRNLDEFENLLSLSEEASEKIKDFSESSSQELSNLANSELANKIEEDLNQTIESLSNQDFYNANLNSQQSLKNMEMMMQQMNDIQQGFNQESSAEMIQMFQQLLQNVLYLSSQEEKLKEDVKQVARNSPRLREFARRQQLLQDQLQSITQQMLELSNETFAITPEIGRGMGKAYAEMEEAKSNLTDRNLSQAMKNHKKAMEGLNEAALGLFNSMQNIQKSGSASGFEQFLQMMQQMAGQQKQINQKGMQLSIGQMAAAMQQQMMQQMLKNQKGLRKSLKQLMNEMKQSGKRGLGDLSGIATDMDEVIKDLQKKRFNRKTKERQQRILSRMLDSQASMTKRGEKDERKSSSAKTSIVFKGPSGLPLDLGQRENLALKALSNAMNAGYSNEDQKMIKRYFNSLSQLTSKIETNE
tara:strand:+ start:4009 stop:7416 length:3408 start_codon:yes stop_codon:yes gene_type:complete